MQTEVIPPTLVRGTFVMHRMRDAVESRLAETQAGFRREPCCHDNVLLLRLLMDAVLRAGKQGKQAVVTFIDYRAAFDTISHRFLDESLTVARVQPKIRRIVKTIYTEATGMVRLSVAAESQKGSRNGCNPSPS